MFKRVVQAIAHRLGGTTGSNSASKSVPAAPILNQAKMKAMDDLKRAMNDLRVSPNGTVTGTTVDVSKLVNLPASEMSVDELDALGRQYYDGSSEPEVPQNVEKAMELWREGAARGSVVSKYSLAMCTKEGVAGEKNPEKAFADLIDIADNHKFSHAQYVVGAMFHKGEGVAQDDVKAVEYFKAAAQSGFLPALYNLGNAYATGRGIPQDDVKAFQMYETAADVGDPTAKFTLAQWLLAGRGCQIDIKRATQLQLEAAQAGHPHAMYNIGYLHLAGNGVPKDLKLAAQWFKRAVEIGDVLQARINLANMYIMGAGVVMDLDKAKELVLPVAQTSLECKQLLEEIDFKIKEKTNQP